MFQVEGTPRQRMNGGSVPGKLEKEQRSQHGWSRVSEREGSWAQGQGAAVPRWLGPRGPF